MPPQTSSLDHNAIARILSNVAAALKYTHTRHNPVHNDINSRNTVNKVPLSLTFVKATTHAPTQVAWSRCAHGPGDARAEETGSAINDALTERMLEAEPQDQVECSKLAVLAALYGVGYHNLQPSIGSELPFPIHFLLNSSAPVSGVLS
ncbi:Uu.00g133920.m01.CDS01 [Anthostomella pinea]|uniref:Uu.00g133920.m01.CDS01 n=1 Tax=Anthostomella pinea TaxID=933095 RepID=A0AAI8VPS8_9PEZI|nr:Uu.00g133920.m01.CDS01 [Anthostomella pinea]